VAPDPQRSANAGHRSRWDERQGVVLCTKGHEWDDTPNHRTSRGSGCAVCAGKRILVSYNDLATRRPDLAIQWHPTRNGDVQPTDVTAGSSKRYWWVDEFGHEW